MSIVRRKEIAMLFYIAPMLFIVFEYYTGVGSNAASALITWGIILSTFTYLIGGFAIFRHHILKIANKKNDWPYSAILMATFASFLGMAYLHQPGYQWVLENVYQPLTILMFGFVGFYTVTALFRGSRVRNLHAGVLITCAVLLMLYNAPVGEAIWPGFQTPRRVAEGRAEHGGDAGRGDRRGDRCPCHVRAVASRARDVVSGRRLR